MVPCLDSSWPPCSPFFLQDVGETQERASPVLYLNKVRQSICAQLPLHRRVYCTNIFKVSGFLWLKGVLIFHDTSFGEGYSPFYNLLQKQNKVWERGEQLKVREKLLGEGSELCALCSHFLSLHTPAVWFSKQKFLSLFLSYIGDELLFFCYSEMQSLCALTAFEVRYISMATITPIFSRENGCSVMYRILFRCCFPQFWGPGCRDRIGVSKMSLCTVYHTAVWASRQHRYTAHFLYFILPLFRNDYQSGKHGLTL